MISPIDINQLHNEFWKQRQSKIDAILAKPHLVAIVARREAAKAHFVKLATDVATRIERIRNQKPFEAELESVAEEFASLSLVKAQRSRAKRPRGKVTDDGKTLDQVIESLLTRAEHGDSSASELWPALFSELDRLQLAPKDANHPTDPRKSAYSCGFDGQTRRISYGRFCQSGLGISQKSRQPGYTKLVTKIAPGHCARRCC